MRVFFKYFSLGILTFILSFFFIYFTNSLFLMAGQLESEVFLLNIYGDGVIIDDFLVNDDTISLDNQIKPAIARNLEGDFVIVWIDFREDYLGDIFAQRFNSSGSLIGTNFKVNSDIALAAQKNPKVGIDYSGNFIITWEDRRFGQSDIYA